MDAQFDFNLYDAAVDAFAKPETSFANLGRVIQESAKYYGSHHMMGNITGNQDRARFISYADGSVKFEENAKQAGWSRKIEHKDNVGYVRLEQLTAFLMSVPGIPCIYYGDEIGMPGGNDPDNRRMMRFDQLNNEEAALRTSTQKLVKLRRKNLPLIYGETYVMQADEKALVIARKYLNQISIAVFAKGEGNVNITLPGYWKGKVSTDGLEIVSTDAGSNSYVLKVGGKGYGFFFVK
jgi:glycosidase